MAKTYGYYSPVANALGVVGDKWSLLIVRDLLRKSQRFTDLLSYLGNITSKLLMLRLRKLEEFGVIEREQGQDQREVWYKLTPAGQQLRRVVAELAAWGAEYAIRPPLPGEVIHPDSAVSTLADFFNHRRMKLPQPITWQFEFTPGGPYIMSFDGKRWSAREGEGKTPDVIVHASPETWLTLITVKRDEQREVVQTLKIEGTPGRVEEFINTVVVRKSESKADSA